MSVNHYKNHLVVFLEDAPYRDILNGVKISSNVNDNVLEVRNPSGGWNKVFDALENNILPLMRKYKEKCHILLLMDFDDQGTDSLDSFISRKQKLNTLVLDEYKDRVFILGANHKESEELKKIFTTPDYERIGTKLVEDCPRGNLTNWDNYVLQCNKDEIIRMQHAGIFEWLFNG